MKLKILTGSLLSVAVGFSTVASAQTSATLSLITGAKDADVQTCVTEHAAKLFALRAGIASGAQTQEGVVFTNNESTDASDDNDTFRMKFNDYLSDYSSIKSKWVSEYSIEKLCEAKAFVTKNPKFVTVGCVKQIDTLLGAYKTLNVKKMMAVSSAVDKALSIEVSKIADGKAYDVKLAKFKKDFDTQYKAQATAIADVTAANNACKSAAAALTFTAAAQGSSPQPCNTATTGQAAFQCTSAWVTANCPNQSNPSLAPATGTNDASKITAFNTALASYNEKNTAKTAADKVIADGLLSAGLSGGPEFVAAAKAMQCKLLIEGEYSFVEKQP